MIRATTLIALAVLFSTVAASWAFQECPKEYYDQCVDEMINKCRRQSEMTGSWSDRLRMDAALEGRKLNFYSDRRQDLVEALKEQEIECRPHPVEHFLIKTYYRVEGR